jgi:transporter family-2 protein
MTTIYLLTGLLAGVFIANMAPVNAGLRSRVDSPFIATAISCGVAVLLLGAVALAIGQPVLPSWDFIAMQPKFLWLGGLIGMAYVISNILLFPKVGAVETVVFPLLGQVLAGVALDAFGLFGMPAVAFTPSRALGVVLLMAGLWLAIVLAARHRREGLGDAVGVARWGWRAWGLSIGGLASVQQTINGALGRALGGTPPAAVQGSVIAFSIAFVVMAAFCLVKHGRAWPTKAQWRTLRAADFLGGLFNALAGLARMWLRAGLPQTYVVALVDFGQIAAGLLVQRFGLWRSPKVPVNLWQFVGLIVLFLGVLLVVGVL